MMRYKWFLIRLPISIEEFVDRLKDNKFSIEKPIGFQLDEESSSEFLMKFYNKVSIPTTDIDELGNPTVTIIQVVEVLKFKLFSKEKTNFLRIENPSKSIKPFLNELDRVAGFGFYIEPIVYGTQNAPSFFSRFDNVKLIGIKLVNLVPDKDIVGRLELASKIGINIDNLKILKDLTYTVDTATFEVIGGLVRGQFSFNKSGLVRVSDKLAQSFLSNYEDELTDLFSVR